MNTGQESKGCISLNESEIQKYLSKVNWEKEGMNGLIPVIAQDINTKEILMQAYVNQEAFQNTLETGNATYWSRSRSEIWEKGLTSGATQKMYNIQIDCDRDSIIYQVEQLGEVGACHIETQQNCFETEYIELRKKTNKDIGDILQELYTTLEQRKRDYKEGNIEPTDSYTVQLMDKGIDAILKKMSEESTEIILGAKNSDTENMVHEIADYLYFLNVFMAYVGIQPWDIARELSSRFGTSGLEKKKNRNNK